MVDCISLFSGAGGLDVGAESAGANIFVCVENDHDSAQTLRLNNTNDNKLILEKDIADISFKEYRRSKSDLVVIGGPPCQPFSKNGYWVKNENRLIEKDPRNLLSQFLRVLEETNANAFIFENVESILHPSNKAEFEKFFTAAENLGYKCTQYKANALDFGVPQRRKRIFVFGVKKRGAAIPAPLPTHSDHKTPLSDHLPPHRGVGEFIKQFDKKKYFELSEVADHGTYFYELSHVPPGTNYIGLSKLNDYDGRTFRSGSRFWNFLFKLHPDKPSITIAAQPGPWVGPFHWNNRRLRVPEIAAIQTFPENYKFFGNRRSVQKQIGNAVPSLLGEKMFKHLVENL